jgi:flagellar assembly factor FliW
VSLSMEPQMTAEQTITITLPRFGACTFSPDEVFEFPWGLPGFTNLRRWLALTVESQSSFVWLQSLDDPAVALPTIDPYFVFEQYEPKLPPYAVSALDISGASDFVLLCVVVAADVGSSMSMNLLAPIVLNLRTRKGRQIPLENSGYSVRESVPRKAGLASPVVP